MILIVTVSNHYIPGVERKEDFTQSMHDEQIIILIHTHRGGGSGENVYFII